MSIGNDHLGELAALGTALCWTLSSLSFTSAGRRVGSLNVNVIRLGMALLMLVGYCWIVRGYAWPTDAQLRTWGWLSLSGVVGFFIGDLCLFEAFVLIGARLSMLLMALAPPLTGLVGWLLLGERLGARGWLGVVVTMAGILLVLAEKHGRSAAPHDVRSLRLGLLLGIGAAAGQAVGLVFSKLGMDGYDAFAATQIRVVAGLAGFMVLVAVRRGWSDMGMALRQWPAMWRTAVGALSGPFLGVGLLLVAAQRIPTGVAATLAALVPVLVIPPSTLWHGEQVGWRGWAGAVIAVGGVALLCLWG